MSGSAFEGIFSVGPRICGGILGSPYQQYRPLNAIMDALNPDNLLATISAWITYDKKGLAQAPNSYAKPVCYSMHDPALTQVGDYFVGPLGTFFVASQDAPHPFQVVSCNHIVSVSKVGGMTNLGVQSEYGGDIASEEITLVTHFPCSMLQGTKGEVGASKLPGDAKQPWVAVLLPPIPGVTLRNDLILTDENKQRFITSSVELSSLGYRMTAMLATT